MNSGLKDKGECNTLARSKAGPTVSCYFFPLGSLWVDFKEINLSSIYIDEERRIYKRLLLFFPCKEVTELRCNAATIIFVL